MDNFGMPIQRNNNVSFAFYAGVSTLCAISTVAYALHTRQQFYPTVSPSVRACVRACMRYMGALWQGAGGAAALALPRVGVWLPGSQRRRRRHHHHRRRRRRHHHARVCVAS